MIIVKNTYILLRILFTALWTLSLAQTLTLILKISLSIVDPGLKNMRELSLLFHSLTKTSLVTMQTRVKQLGVAFKKTQMRPHILVGPINSKQWFRIYQTTDACGGN
jgi:hypothetical protein